MPIVSLPQAIELAARHVQAGRLEEAEKLCQQILDKYPDEHRLIHLLGVIALHRGQQQIALGLMDQAIAFDATVPDYHCNRGTLLLAMNRRYEAIAEFQQTLTLSPGNPEAHFNLALAYIAQGQFETARTELEIFVQLRPASAQGFSHLGQVLWKLSPGPEAVEAFRKASLLDPNLPTPWTYLGYALQNAGKLDEAADCFRTAMRLAPEAAFNYRGLANVLADQGDLDSQLDLYDKAIELEPDEPGSQTVRLFIMNYLPATTPQQLRQQSLAWGQRLAEPLAGLIRPHPNDRDPNRILRIGFVSPDLFTHSVRFYLTPLFDHLDRSKVEVHCYANVQYPDEVTALLKSKVDAWHDIVRRSDDDVAEEIRADNIDVLIDLAMLTSDNRAALFARKPAPVQVAWLAHPGCTGLPTIDYRLTDRFLDPPSQDELWASERPFRLPDWWVCYDPGDECPAVGEVPALRNHFITFGSLNTFRKINRPLLELWARVMLAVPDSRLMLLTHEGSHRQRLAEFMESQGIAANRLRLESPRPRKEYLALYHEIDIQLDPSPYNGQTTSCDGLWMGAPLVTLPGQLPVSRAGLGLLTNLGMEQGIAGSEEDFVQRAVSLAGDLPRLGELRATLRQRMQASPIMDAPRYAGNFAAALRAMWRQWCG